MKNTLLLTRPLLASRRWALRLAGHGFECVIEPLLTIAPTGTARPQLKDGGKFQAVVFTSAHAPLALEERKTEIADLLGLPCFCVGAATADAARECGFTVIKSGASDSAELAYLIAAALPDTRPPLLHIAGDNVDAKAVDFLTRGGFTIATWVIYRAIAAEDLSAATRQRLTAGDIAAIPIFSPRSAHILVSLIEKNGLTSACHRISAVGLSQAVADVLQILPWRRLRVAASPAADDVIAALLTECAMIETEKKPLPPTAAPAPPRPKSWNGVTVIVALLAGIIGGIGAQVFFLSASPAPQDAPVVAALAKRLDSMETKINELTQITAVTPPAAAPDADLAAAVKNLQDQMALMQSQGVQSQQNAHQWVAAAFAFQDLHAAAQAGRPFAAQLAALRKSASDAAIEEQAALLAPYADAPPPTVVQLKDELVALESSISTPVTATGEPTWRERIKSALGALVSIHPLHNPEFADLEQALDKGEAQDALDAFHFLPDAARHDLSGWREKLEARVALDKALANLAALFATPAVGTAP